MSKKALIIGAGPAGLTAAYALLRDTDIKPIIFEESTYMGGISRTVEYKGNRMDLGGHRFFSKSEDVMNLWRELMPVQGSPALDDKLLNRVKPLVSGGPDPERVDKVWLIRNRVSRIYYLRKFFDYPISLKFQTFANMGLSRTISAGLGYLSSIVAKRPESSLEDFYINRFGKPLYQMFFEDYTEKLWGVHPSKISPEWGAQRVKGLSLVKVILAVVLKPFSSSGKTETSLIEEFLYPKKGPGQLWETLADRIVEMGGEIITGACVTGVHADEAGAHCVNAITVARDGGEQETITGDYVISTMPIADLVPALQGTVVPEEVRDIATSLPYRDFITAGVLVKKLLISNKTEIRTINNIVPDCWIYVQERDVKLGRIQIFNNWSPYLVKNLQDTVWIGLEYFCTEGDELWNRTDEEFTALAVDELAKIGVVDPADVLDCTRINVKKAYPAYFGSYEKFDVVRHYLDSFENLFCIGRNGQHRYNNMDHSMLTALEAVRAIMSGTTSKEDIWNVNTEEEYHETSTSESEAK